MIAASFCVNVLLLVSTTIVFVVGNKEDDVYDYSNLITELCVGFCNGSDCEFYMTLLSVCYNGQSLFPNDPSWGDVDLMDEIVDGMLERSFFRTNDGTCTDETDHLSLPLEECVGPFGKPRPWGKFSLSGRNATKTQGINESIERP